MNHPWMAVAWDGAGGRALVSTSSYVQTMMVSLEPGLMSFSVLVSWYMTIVLCVVPAKEIISD